MGKASTPLSPRESEITCSATTSGSPRGPLEQIEHLFSTLPSSLSIKLKSLFSGNSKGSSAASSPTSEEGCEPMVIQEASIAIRPGQGHECQDEAFYCRLTVEDGCDLADDADAWLLTGVADGHGKHGAHAACLVRRLLREHACAEPFHSCLCSQASTQEDIEAALKVLASEVQVKLERCSELEMSGSTCCFALMDPKTRQLILSNTGDSRAVLASLDASGQIKCILVTTDHKPEFPEEEERITSEGGIVQRMTDNRDFEPCGPHRVYEKFEDSKPADGPGLAMSRSFGDLCAHRIGVTHVPSTYFHTITNEDCFLVLATDGVWDVMETEEVVSFVEEYMRAPHEVATCNSAGEKVMVPVTPAAALTLEAMYRWNLKPGKAKDDISAVVLPLPAYVQGEPVQSDIPKVLMSPATRNEDTWKPDPIPWTIKMKPYFGEEQAGTSSEGSPTSPMSPLTPRKFGRRKSSGIAQAHRKKCEQWFMQKQKGEVKPIPEDAATADGAPPIRFGGQEICSVKVSRPSTRTQSEVVAEVITARDGEATSQGGPTPAPSPFSLAESFPSTPETCNASALPLVNSRSCPTFTQEEVIATLMQRASSGDNLEGRVHNGAPKASRAKRTHLEVIALLEQRASSGSDLEGRVYNGASKASPAKHADFEGRVHNGGILGPWMKSSLTA